MRPIGVGMLRALAAAAALDFIHPAHASPLGGFDLLVDIDSSQDPGRAKSSCKQNARAEAKRLAKRANKRRQQGRRP